MSTAFRHSCLVPPSSTALSSARARSCTPIRPFLAETEQFTQALSVSLLGASSTLGGNSVGLDIRFDDSRGNMILTRSRHTILPKSTTLASRGASRFRALRSGTVKIPVDSHRPHSCVSSPDGLRDYSFLRVASLASSVVHCMIIDFDVSAFGLRAAHGGHAFLSVLAVFFDGMTVCALTSESRVLDVAALMNPTLHDCLKVSVRATREVSKTRGTPRR